MVLLRKFLARCYTNYFEFLFMHSASADDLRLFYFSSRSSVLGRMESEGRRQKDWRNLGYYRLTSILEYNLNIVLEMCIKWTTCFIFNEMFISHGEIFLAFGMTT